MTITTMTSSAKLQLWRKGYVVGLTIKRSLSSG